MMKKRIHFIKLIKLWGIIFLLGMGVSIVAMYVIGSLRDFKLRADQMRADYIAGQKEMIKQEVNRVVDLISYEKAQSERLTKSKIKSRVYEAYSIAQHIYQQNKTTKSKAEIQEMILEALRPIRFESGSGYYFATRLDGVEMLFADKPEMEGLNLLEVQDTRGQYVIKDLIAIARQSGEGFYEYHWTKPDSVGNDFKKISFIKRFEPYDWFIGTGLYVDEVEGHIKADLLSAISRIRFGKEGYIFINRLNGDALVSNGTLFSGTKKLWEVFNKNPEKMKDIFNKEYQAALKPEGDYIYYSHVKLTTPNEESPKASFICGIPELQWLVGAGVYLDDVETDIAAMQTKLNNQIKEKMFYSILIVTGIVALSLLFFNWLNRGLKNDFNLFVSFFKGAAHSDEEIDREHIKFVELDQIAEYANKMLTDRKQAENALRESEEQFKFLAENMADIIWTVNLDFQTTYVSPSIEKILGFTPEERKRQTIEEIVTPESLKNVRTTFQEELLRDQSGHADPDRSVTIEVEYYHKDGSTVWMENRMKAIRDHSGIMEGIYGVSHNITERKIAEEEKTKLRHQLQQIQKMESIGTLAGGIAHDFNNVLGIIVGNTELAMDDVPEWHPARHNLQEIRTASIRARDVVKQILAFSRQSPQEKKPVRMTPIIEESLKLLRSSIPSTIQIQQNISSETDIIRADPTQINQVLINLCTNAVHAMGEKAGVLEVSLENIELDEDSAIHYHDLSPGKYLKLTVNDTGHGIKSNVLDRIFDPYFTTKEIGKGSGMGLSVVHGIVKSHGGRISVMSEPGKGTVFHVLFPCIEDEPEPEVEMTDEIPRGNERILFVDDEKAMADTIQPIIERLGYEVTVRTSSIEALEAFRANPDRFDLVITDFTMPNMNGLELARKLFKLRTDIPVILCTGYSEHINEDKAKKIGIRAFVMKPVILNEIANTIREALNHR